MLKFELSEKMVEIIGQALGAQPYNTVAQVIAELHRQISAQQPEIPQQKPNGKILKHEPPKAVKKAEENDGRQL